MKRSAVGLPLLVILVVAAGVRAGDNAAADEAVPQCPSTFHFLHQAYGTCAPSPYRDEMGAPLQFPTQQQITGSDVVTELQRMCTSRQRMKQCARMYLARCSAHLRDVYQSAMDKAMWFCDEDNSIKASVASAIIGTEPVPEAEKNKSVCLDHPMLSRCPQNLLGTPRFSRIRNYGDLIREDAEQVLSDPIATQYFRELFDCYYDIVYPICPHNAIPMVLVSQRHLITPPKFGINISQIIIDKAHSLQNPVAVDTV